MYSSVELIQIDASLHTYSSITSRLLVRIEGRSDCNRAHFTPFVQAQQGSIGAVTSPSDRHGEVLQDCVVSCVLCSAWLTLASISRHLDPTRSPRQTR